MANARDHDVSADDRDVRDDIFLGDPDYLVSARFEGFREAEQATANLLDEGFPSDRQRQVGLGDPGAELNQPSVQIHPN